MVHGNNSRFRGIGGGDTGTGAGRPGSGRLRLWLGVTFVVVVVVGTAVTGVAAQSDSRLRGEVQYQNGTAAGDTDVEIVDIDTNSVVETKTTRSDGTWGPDQFSPGNYTTQVDKPGFKSFATRVELGNGETEKIFMTLKSGNIEGTVTDTDGDPVGGLEIELRNLDTGSTERRVTTRSDGTYGPNQVRANVNYTVRVVADEWEGTAPQVNVTIGETETINVDVERTVGELSVKATDGDGDPVDGVTVEVIDDDTGAVAAANVTAADGTIPAVTLDPGAYTARITDNDWQSTADTVQLLAGERRTIALEGTRTESRVSGTVTNAAGDPIDGATVTIRNASTGGTVASATTSSDGTWGPLVVSSGRLRLDATASGYQAADRTIEVSPGENTSRQFTLEATGGIRIAATDTALEDGTLTTQVGLRNEAEVTRQANVSVTVDGTTRAGRTVSLAGGETRTVTLETDLPATDGPYDVTIEAGSESLSTAVEAESTPTDTPASTSTADATVTDAPTDTPTSDGDGAGFGLLIAGVALAVAAVSLLARRQ